MHHWSYGFCGYVHFLSIVQHVPHGQASPQEAKGDAEFAATIQSNLAAAYAKKGDHNNALAAAEEVRSAWCFLQIFFVFYLRYLSLIRGCPLQATQIHTNSWNLSMNIGQCHTLVIATNNCPQQDLRPFVCGQTGQRPIHARPWACWNAQGISDLRSFHPSQSQSNWSPFGPFGTIYLITTQFYLCLFLQGSRGSGLGQKM